MTLELLFKISNAAAVPFWILLVIKPRWKWSHNLIYSAAFPLLMAILYTTLFAMNWGRGPEGGGFGSLEGVAVLFTSKQLLLAGWIHYICFDLLVGSWEVRDAMKHDIPHWLVVPCLFFTLFFGPAGFLLYMLIRYIKTRKALIAEF